MYCRCRANCLEPRNGNDMKTKIWLGHKKEPLNANNNRGIVVLKSRGHDKHAVYSRTPTLFFEVHSPFKF